MPETSPATAAALAHVPLFADLPTPTLAWLAARGQVHTYPAGAVVTGVGDEVAHLLALLTGTMQFYTVRGGNREPIFRLEAGQVSGVLPYSRLREAKGESVAVTAVTLYLLPRTEFAALEQQSPELVQRLVSLMNDRARTEARGQERDDKLRALGKLSAGLAHELNNPAAAIGRAAETLAQNLQLRPQLLQQLLLHCPTPAALTALLELSSPPPAASPLSGLARADAEDALADWLEQQGVADGYQLAAGLLDAGLLAPALQVGLAEWPPAARPAALAWLESQLTARRLVQDVQEAGSRISTLVDNVKTYSHMDRGQAFAPLDVRAGLDSTLNMLGYPLRAKQLELVRDYASELPLVRGQVSSLNQVWTNLLDNAIDALPPGGQLTVRAWAEDEFVRVLVLDNGPGIAPDVLPRILEPFFTTKPAGEGSGLGLDIALRIVEQHGGRLEVQSEPGRTEFGVWLPVGPT